MFVPCKCACAMDCLSHANVLVPWIVCSMKMCFCHALFVPCKCASAMDCLRHANVFVPLFNVLE